MKLRIFMFSIVVFSGYVQASGNMALWPVPQRILEDPSQVPLDSRVSKFPWDEFEALDEAWERGDHLSVAQMGRYFLLRSQHYYLGEPERPTKTSKTTTQKHYTVPGMRMAGCGQSADKGTTEKSKTEELESMSDEEAAQATVISLANCQLEHLPDLRRFTAVEQLDLSFNKLFEAGDLSFMTRLRKIDASYNQLQEFPIAWHDLLVRNKNSQRPELNLQGNPLRDVPTTLRPDVMLTLSNDPLLRDVSGELRTSLEFSNDYPSAILKGRLYLGGRSDLTPRIITHLKITYVLNCANELKSDADKLKTPTVKVEHLSLDDQENEEVDFVEFARMIHEALERGQIVLVNCAMGRSRSASVMLAYMMLYQKKSLIEAIRHVKRQRQQICPNPGFMRKLLFLDIDLSNFGNFEQVLREIEGEFPDIKVATSDSNKTNFNDGVFGTFLEETELTE